MSLLLISIVLTFKNFTIQLHKYFKHSSSKVCIIIMDIASTLFHISQFGDAADLDTPRMGTWGKPGLQSPPVWKQRYVPRVDKAELIRVLPRNCRCQNKNCPFLKGLLSQGNTFLQLLAPSQLTPQNQILHSRCCSQDNLSLWIPLDLNLDPPPVLAVI